MQPQERVDSPSQDNIVKTKPAAGWLITIVVIGVAVALSGILWYSLSVRSPKENEAAPESKSQTEESIDISNAISEVKLVTVTNIAPAVSFTVAGGVEPNQQQQQQVTPLVAGRVENIYVSIGDYVNKGTLLMRINSPQVAEQHGKLHEAETRVVLARTNLNRVQQAANRVSILKAKATLDEADATLKRTAQLVSEGLSARKDLVAAQSEYDRAQADFNFQKDISLNREVADARAELQTAETEAKHLKNSLKAMDAELGPEKSDHPISKIELRSPIAGTVIERFVNPGAGFELGKPLLTIANTSTLWVIANVPESQMYGVSVGSPAVIKFGNSTILGKVNYIDPRLNEDTRTSRVRIEIENPANKIQVGTFVQVEFKTSGSTARPNPFVPESAVQKIEKKSVVFVQDSAGQFQRRDVEVGTSSGGMVPILSGLKIGERIASDGSFILKSKLLKEQFGEE